MRRFLPFFIIIALLSISSCRSRVEKERDLLLNTVLDLRWENGKLRTELNKCHETIGEQKNCTCKIDPSNSPQDPSDVGTARTTSVRPDNVRVVIVSIDGLHTALVSEMWRFRKLFKSGSWTMTAQTTSPSTTTVAHASMFTGVDPATHGIRGEAPRNPVKLAHWHPLRVRTIFQMVDKKTYRPMLFVQKKKLENIFPESAASRKYLDTSLHEAGVIRSACAELGKPSGSRLIFIHLKGVDHFGHTRGWLSPAQRSAARRIDKALGDLSNCIADGQRKGPDITLIVTADHGGHGHSHWTNRPSDKTIPWLVIGPGVKTGHRIIGRVHVMDTAPTALYFLGVRSARSTFQGKMPEGILN